MKFLKLKISGMHCEACEKVLKKALSRLEHVKDIDLHYNNEIATVSYNPEINVNEIIDIVRQVGYDATIFEGEDTFIDVNFKKYLKILKQKDQLEGQLILISFATLIILSILEVITYFGFFRDIPGFFNRYGYYLVFLVISSVVVGASVLHIKKYGSSFSCMSGMMVGMTTGMISGFLVGMLVGSILGILIGMFIGIFTGKCCGIMGIMEGMMAGLMGGLMGAMTSLMMLNDNLKLIVPVLVVASSTILIGLDYMIYKEKSYVKEKINKEQFLSFIITCSIITLALTFLMVVGPKS